MREKKKNDMESLNLPLGNRELFFILPSVRTHIVRKCLLELQITQEWGSRSFKVEMLGDVLGGKDC